MNYTKRQAATARLMWEEYDQLSEILDEADEETRAEYLAEKLTLIGRRLFDCHAVGLDTIEQCAEANSRSQVKL